ncbi:MAG TPA: efflux RND transporter permease subunit [Polyangiales bacterium]
MWLVRIALARPYTFLVMAVLIVLLGVGSIRTMSTDILPEIDIPVVVIVWSYNGLTPEEMEKRVVGGFERFLTTTVNDIEHVESQAITGFAVIKVFFHPGAKIEAATAQITATSQTAVRSLPPGAVPPLILRYSASNAPVLQLVLESDKMSEQQLFDVGVNSVRGGVGTVQGAGVPYPYGGKFRQVMVDIDLPRLYAWGLSPRDVINAVNVQNLTLPTGTIKMGANEYPVVLNSSPDTLEELSRLPLRTVNGKTVALGDVASVRDGFAPQTSIVHANGKRAVVMPILKSAGASTLEVVSRVRQKLVEIADTLPEELKVSPVFDQSVFVRAAVDGVIHEGVLAAALTGLMMLLFLGSWRSTLIVVVSIPLSILVATIILRLTGQTLNLMTLGGLSLAVGILVDDATVELENIHRNLEQGKPLLSAILDGAREIAVPAFVSTLCICIVFVPVAFIAGSARSLFVPLAMSVVFAMLTSYFLSRTLVPTLVRLLLAKEHQAHATDARPGLWQRFRSRFEAGFERLTQVYRGALDAALTHPVRNGAIILALIGASLSIYPRLGRDFFPAVDAGLIRLHVRASPGTRIEETERLFAALGQDIRRVIPESELGNLINNIGVTTSPINLSMSDGTMISSSDGEIQVALKPGHRPTRFYVEKLRAMLGQAHPDVTFFFLAPDISTQVLNFGISAPIDIQIMGPPPNTPKNLALARELLRELSNIDGIVDARLHQVTNTPQVKIDVDRNAAQRLGLSQRDVANDVLVALASSGQTAPSFWLDPKKGVQYSVAVQSPQHRLDSLGALEAIPIGSGLGGGPNFLGNVAEFSRQQGATNITHFNAMPTYDVLANVSGKDLGSVADSLRALLARYEGKLPRGTTITLKGQIESMEESFTGLAYGLVFAILLVYLLMVVNYQSLLDPFVILTALPAAIAGIGWMLFATQTTVSVPALMGAIMCVGVATANSILVVTFANDLRRQHPEGSISARAAALEAGATRLRPVIMTAFAMIVGMLPMSLGLGEGGEQNAPLGRAVIGGLCLATLSTLFFVPLVYSVLRHKAPRRFIVEESP